GDTSDILNIASIYRINDSQCQDHFRANFAQGLMFCAGDSERKVDTCKGDSGGPIVKRIGHNYFVAGIVSFGYKCGSKIYNGIYTNVSNYVLWISKHTNITSFRG
ncbi:coagulation factor VII-like protein, partial [Leptotrombidium deliense]